MPTESKPDTQMDAGAWGRESREILTTLRNVVRRRKAVLGLCVLTVLTGVVVYNEVTPPLYESFASVVFEELGSPVPNDVSVMGPKESFLFNRIEEIKSRAFADDIAKALPDSIRARFPEPATKTAGYDRTEHVGDMIQKSLTAYPLRTSNIVRIRVQMSDPYLCWVVANTSLGVLEDRSYRVRREGATDLRKFLEDQLTRFSAQLKESDSNLMKFKEENSITSLDDQTVEMLRKMTEAEVLANATHANQGAAEERLAAIQRTLAEQRKELVPAVTNIASPSAQRLKDQLVSLQAQYAQLVVQEYPVSHPQRIRLQQEIVQTERALAEEAMKLAKEGHVGDPIAQIERYINESVSLQIEIESLKARERALNQAVDGYRQVLSGLPSKEVQLARLVRERDVNAKIYTTLLERREEIRISEAKRIPNSRVVDRAQLPADPIRPRKRLNLALGTMVGLFFGMGIGLILENGPSRLGSMNKFERDTGWPVLALVPQIDGDPTRRTWGREGLRKRKAGEASRTASLVSHLNPESAVGESYFMLRTRLELLGIGTKHRSLLVTSSAPQEGKSNTISNLAATFGTAGVSTLVVDAELRRPVMHGIFGTRKEPGLTDLLLTRNGDRPEPAALAEAAPPVASGRKSRAGAVAGGDVMFQSTKVNGVTLLASGKRLRQTQWERARAGMRSLLGEVGKQYDIILVDSASPILVHDTLILCGMVDAVLVVVNAQAYDPDRLMETKRLLERAGANVVGAVINKVDPGGAYAYYYSHHYSHDEA